MRRRAHGSGFTLIELMIAVAIIGVLASVALPAFSQYMMQSKAAELPENLGLLYRGMAAYYQRPHAADRTLGAADAGHCLVGHLWCNPGDLMVPPFPPGKDRREGDFYSCAGPQALNFSPAGPVYGSYAMGSTMGDDGACGIDNNTFGGGTAAVFLGVVDLDGDGQYGGMSVDIGVKEDQLYRAAGFGSLSDGLQEAFGVGCPFCAATTID